MSSREPEDQSAFERFRLEQFYRQSIDAELLDFDADGRLKLAVTRYTLLLSPDDHIFWGVTDLDTALMDRGERIKMKRAMTDVLTSAGIWAESGFDTTAFVEKKSLSAFVTACRKNEQVLLDYYNVKLRSRFEEKPVQQLGEVLKAFGLSWGRAVRDQSSGESRLSYRIDKEAHDRLMMGYRMHTDEDRLHDWKRKKGL